MENQERRSGIGMLIFILVLLIALLFIGWRYFRVSKIEVEGNVNIKADYIAMLTGIKTDQNLFAINTDKVKTYINSDPYLEYYALKRIYPSTVRVEVYERIPAALLIGKNKNYVLDNQGNVLEAIDQMDYTLMRITGLEGFTAIPGQSLSTQTPYQYDALTAILKDVEYNTLSKMVMTMDISDINQITMRTNIGFTVMFGQAEKVSDKIIWIEKAIEELAKSNITTGTINVVSGDSAAYSK
ncbi:MAG: FtsQ-type POTRA domain-containing protein [Eubacteriales bacterium]